jgi:hypothetical protein
MRIPRQGGSGALLVMMPCHPADEISGDFSTVILAIPKYVMPSGLAIPTG